MMLECYCVECGHPHMVDTDKPLEPKICAKCGKKPYIEHTGAEAEAMHNAICVQLLGKNKNRIY